MQSAKKEETVETTFFALFLAIYLYILSENSDLCVLFDSGLLVLCVTGWHPQLHSKFLPFIFF